MTAVDHGSSDLATRLVEVRQRNASTKRCLDEGHAALAEARKRVHRLQAELSAGQQEEGEIVEALGGEAAAAAAAEGVETCTAVGSGNGRPEPAVQAAHEAALADLSQQQHHQQEQPFAIQQQEWQQQQQQPMQQQQAWQQPAMPLPGGAHAGYMLVPIPQGHLPAGQLPPGQAPVVMFNAHSYAAGPYGAVPQPLPHQPLQLAQMQQQQMQQQHMQQQQQPMQQQLQLSRAPYHASNSVRVPADARPPAGAPRQAAPRLPPPPAAARGTPGAVPSLSGSQQAAHRGFAQALQGIGAGPGSSRGPSPGGLSPAGSGTLSAASKEFVPRSVQPPAAVQQGGPAQEQPAQQEAQQQAQHALQEPAEVCTPAAAATVPAAAAAAAFTPGAARSAAANGPPPGFAVPSAGPTPAPQPAQSVAGPAAAKGPPPGFAGAAAAAVAAIPEPEPKPVEASPLAPFPMPGRPPRPPPPAAAAPVAPPLPLQPPPPRQPQEPPQQQQQQEEQPQPEQQPPLQQQQQQAAAPPPFRRTTGPDTANDAALAAALGAGSDSDDEDLSAAMQRVRMGHRPPAPTNAGEGLGSAGRGWGRGSAAGGRGRAPGAPPPGPPADEAPPVIGGSAADFPALGARPMSAPAPLVPAPAVPAPALQPTGTANGQQPRGWGSGAWGSQSLLAKLAASAPPAPDGPAEAQRAAQQAAPPAGVASVEVLEARAGLRVPGDATPDATCKRQVQQQRQTFEHKEPSIKGGRHTVNVVEGLELHRGVLTPAEQALVVDEVERWKALGTSGHLRGRTFSASKKWLPGKGRVTMQFGCCYNYARGQLGRDPGIIPDEVVEPMPLLLRALCRRLTRWGLLPAAKEPNSAIINIYEAGDCIPPHVDHFDFIRPFCTLSLLSEQSIMFGQRLAPAGPGEFVGHGGETVLIPLPKGSCLVLKGHGGDSAMHCVPPVAERRISITLRRMAPEHEAAVQREVQKLGAAHGGRLLGFWEQEAAGGGGGRRGSGSVMIK